MRIVVVPDLKSDSNGCILLVEDSTSELNVSVIQCSVNLQSYKVKAETRSAVWALAQHWHAQTRQLQQDVREEKLRGDTLQKEKAEIYAIEQLRISEQKVLRASTYRKFVLLLNAKKRKLQELSCKLREITGMQDFESNSSRTRKRVEKKTNVKVVSGSIAAQTDVTDDTGDDFDDDTDVDDHSETIDSSSEENHASIFKKAHEDSNFEGASPKRFKQDSVPSFRNDSLEIGNEETREALLGSIQPRCDD